MVPLVDEVGCVPDLGEAKVAHLDVAVLAHKEVLHLDVPVDDRGVAGVEPQDASGRVPGHPDALDERDAAAVAVDDELLEVGLHQLAHDGDLPGDGGAGAHGEDDVGVAEGEVDLDLAAHLGELLGGEVALDVLDGYLLPLALPLVDNPVVPFADLTLVDDVLGAYLAVPDNGG